MKIRNCFIFPALFCALTTPLIAEEGLTIYNDNFAIVRTTVPLDLREGINEVTTTNVTRKMETDSVILRDPAGEVPLQILEQSYRKDPLDQKRLYEFFEGQTIDFLVSHQQKPEEIRQGKILRAPYSEFHPNEQDYRLRNQDFPLLVEVDGRVWTSAPGIPLFPSLPDDTLLKPTLRWELQSPQAAQLEAELSFMTAGLSWEAAYNAVLAEEGDQMDFIGWITMDNQSGKTFEDARIKLMAGDVHKLKDEDGDSRARTVSLGLAEDRAAPPVTEEAFDEYHLYTLENRTTLYDAEQKQVEFIRAEEVTADQVFVYKGFETPPYRGRGVIQDPNYGTQSNSKVWIMREFKNSEENNLGMPLPAGILRFYRRDSAGLLQFIGENTIDHTPKDETVRVYTGNAFDLVGERKQLNFDLHTRESWAEEKFEIKVRNRKEEETVTIRVVEDLYRWLSWEITETSMDFEKTDSRTIEYRVNLEPGEEKTITYTVKYTW